MTVEIKNLSELKEILSPLKLGDSFIFIKSSLSDKEINYNEFVINLKASDLNCDVEADFGFEPNRVKCTFISKVDSFFYSRVIRINKNVVHTTVKAPTLSIKKGDTVKTVDGFIGIIIKYPSNKEITLIEHSSQEEKTVCKEDIIGKL